MACRATNSLDLRLVFHSESDNDATIKVLRDAGYEVERCDCAWGLDIKSVFDPNADALDRAIAITPLEMKPAFELIRENLRAEEECLLATDCSVTDMGDLLPGCFVVTDSHFCVGFRNAELGKFYSQRVSRSEAGGIERLRGTAGLASVRIPGIHLQMIEFDPSIYGHIEWVIEHSGGSMTPDAKPVEDSPALAPLEAMKQLQEMLDQGFISESDFEEKKQDILKRL
jgi:hypothetical protein